MAHGVSGVVRGVLTVVWCMLPFVACCCVWCVVYGVMVCDRCGVVCAACGLWSLVWCVVHGVPGVVCGVLAVVMFMGCGALGGVLWCVAVCGVWGVVCGV